MGIGNSTRKIPNIRELEKSKGYFPKKLTAKKSNFKYPKYQFLIFNKNLYKMETSSLEFEKIFVNFFLT